MAKIAKKKQTNEVNPRSRAAKRASSPSIDTDKSLKNAPRAEGADAILGVTRNSGISKKKKSKQMTRGQRARQEKGLVRAEAVMDQMEKKVDVVQAKTKKRHMRKAVWDEINANTADEKRKTANAPGRATIIEKIVTKENAPKEGDIDMGIVHGTSETTSTIPQEQTTTEIPSTNTPLPTPQDELDLIT